MAEPVVEFDGVGEGASIDESARIDGSRIRVEGEGTSVVIGPRVKGRWDVYASRGAKVTIGAGASCRSAMVVATRDVHIGRGTMLAAGVEIRTTDTHAIYDVESGRRVNEDRPVHIGEHVWISRGVTVLKGARIGAGSVVGIQSVVAGKIPALSVAAGVPAKVVRRGATWTKRIRGGTLEGDKDAMGVVKRWWKGPEGTAGARAPRRGLRRVLAPWTSVRRRETAPVGD